MAGLASERNAEMMMVVRIIAVLVVVSLAGAALYVQMADLTKEPTLVETTAEIDLNAAIGE